MACSGEDYEYFVWADGERVKYRIEFAKELTDKELQQVERMTADLFKWVKEKRVKETK